MAACPYCGSNVNAGVCGFCDMKVNMIKEFEMKPYISHDDLHKTTPELMTYHTADLLKLLKLGREERREFYKQLTVFKKAGNETEQFRDIEKQTGNDYEYITRKTRVIEKLLKDRIGYTPNRVTDQLLSTVIGRVEQEKLKERPEIVKKKPELSIER